MKFLLLVCIDPSIEPDIQPGEMDRWLERAGEARVLGNELRPPSDGWTIRLRGGKPFVTDGPFAETKEFIGGFDVIECDSREEALEIAAAHPVARFGAIELREIEGE
jgi:hypothetical protein